MRSPSQWPGTARISTSFGLSAIGVMSCNCPRRSWPRARGRRVLRDWRRSLMSSVRKATARIGIDVCVDRFVTDALLRIVRIHDLQLASALLRRPALAHPTQDPAPKPRIGYQPAFLPKPPGFTTLPGPRRMIHAFAAVPPHFPADCARRAIKPAGYGPPA